MKNIIKENADNLGTISAKVIAEEISSVLNRKNNVMMGISGGNSVKEIFSHLREENISWEKVNIFFIDERFVPLDSDESNYKQALDYFPNSSLIPITYTNLNDSAIDYTSKFYNKGEKFDIIILGAGEDSHIASLFPGHPEINSESSSFIAITDSPKPPKERITASKVLLKKSDCCFLVFLGDSKRIAYDMFNNPDISEEECPSKITKAIKNLNIITNLEIKGII